MTIHQQIGKAAHILDHQLFLSAIVLLAVTGLNRNKNVSGQNKFWARKILSVIGFIGASLMNAYQLMGQG